jgi:hypothetical protein
MKSVMIFWIVLFSALLLGEIDYNKLLCALGLHIPDNIDMGSEAFCVYCHKKLRDPITWPRE